MASQATAAVEIDQDRPTLTVQIRYAYARTDSAPEFHFVLVVPAADKDGYPGVYRGVAELRSWKGIDEHLDHYVEQAGTRALRELILGEGQCRKRRR